MLDRGCTVAVTQHLDHGHTVPGQVLQEAMLLGQADRCADAAVVALDEHPAALAFDDGGGGQRPRAVPDQLALPVQLGEAPAQPGDLAIGDGGPIGRHLIVVEALDAVGAVAHGITGR